MPVRHAYTKSDEPFKISIYLSSLRWAPLIVAAKLLAMYPPPSPAQICPFSDAEGLGCGCIQLNEAAALERTPRNLWGFIGAVLLVLGFRVGKYMGRL